MNSLRSLCLSIAIAVPSLFFPAESHQSVYGQSLSFRECQAETQLFFRHISPISPQRHLHLFMGSGLAWADFDRDGELDLFFCQGNENPGSPQGNRPAVDLWRGRPQSALSNYQSATRSAGFNGTAHAMGITVADFDNDGFSDLFVTGLFSAGLFHNNGDGTFVDQTAAAGIEPFGFGAGCCWCDLDRDGNLDLVYVRYVKMDPDRYPLCTVPHKGRDYAVSCNPKRLPADVDSVYRNLGDGLFEEITRSAGFSDVTPRHGLGCVALDLDDDGQVELFIANDGMPNDLWKNAGGLKFEEKGLLAGVALNRFGAAEAGMGIAVGDIDGDLKPDLLVTNYFDETNTVYRNEGDLLFLDVTEEMGIAAPSRKRLGFGASFADFDNDGWLDLYVANGHVQDQLPLMGFEDQTFAQKSQLFANRKGLRFDEVSPSAGEFFQRACVARGSAVADFNRDGKSDLAVLLLNDQVALLHNTCPTTDNWLMLELQGIQSNRDAVGAVVVVRAGERAWRRDRQSSASYFSADGPDLHFGVGQVDRVDSVHVRWPSGRSETFVEVPTRQTVRLVEGRGTPNE